MTSAPATLAPDITVVIPTLGGPLLDDCLASIAAGSTWPARIVVVDQGGGAAAGAVARARQPGLEFLHLPCPATGISAATNRGLEQVRTPYVAVTHDDCRVRRDWLDRLANRLREGREAIVTGCVEPEGDGVVLTVKTAAEPAVYTAPRLDGDVLFPPNMGFDVRLLSRIGWFDEHPSLATAGEDNEWAHRALRAGVAIVYEPSAAVGHLARHARADLPALYRRYARGQGAFYAVWLRRGDLLIWRRAARDLLRAPWLLLRGLATGNRDLISMAQGELTGLPAGLLAGLRNPGVRHGRRAGGVGDRSRGSPG